MPGMWSKVKNGKVNKKTMKCCFLWGAHEEQRFFIARFFFMHLQNNA